jgi:hypothetical protein
MPEVYLEAHLKDEKGETFKTLKIPDPDANFWVRHRQILLAQALGDDQPVEPREGERISAVGGRPEKVAIWKKEKEGPFKLHLVEEHLLIDEIPKNIGSVPGPSEWSLLLARSYMRSLCRLHGAASVELFRHSRNFIYPAMWLTPDPPPNLFEEMICTFGEYHLED